MAEGRALTVGIGASAGGVEALQSFFGAAPLDAGLAFIVVMHLAEGRASALRDILARATGMAVVAARNGMTIEPDHVYVLATDSVLTVRRGRLQLRQHRGGASRERHTIDVFFASLAEDVGENAVAIILSGVGNDGTLGAKAIKERGGLTIAQQADHSAPRHPEMPMSAVASGAIDLDIPVEAMGPKLVEYAQGLGRLDPETQPRDRRGDIDRARETICEILLDQVGHNFAGYKERTMLRRIERRMQVLEQSDINRYIARLREDRGEVVQLFQDLLIGVTAFFRDREAFDTLDDKVIPRLFVGKGAADIIRVWVPGCSTGEEVYSIAILLLQQMAGLKARPKVQCFATDIDDGAIAVARSATYPVAMLREVPPDVLDRYFTGDGSTYTLTKEVRDLCIFSSHSVIRDPPFSRIDLISCRNLLIYLDTDLQSQLIPVFHYALRPGGFLFLGSSENLTRHSDLFAPVDKRHRIFQRRDSAANLGGFSLVMPGTRQANNLHQHPLVRSMDGLPLRQSVERQVLERFAPAHVVVTRAGDIVHYSPRTSKYLENAVGAPSRQVVAMARRGLRIDLRAALNEAVETRRTQMRCGLALELDDRTQIVDLTIEPLPELDGEPLFLVVFTDVGAPRSTREAASEPQPRERADVQHLEHELRDTRERLQSMVEEYETALEELKSANEELVSTNEELQSTNEELETSREETQSINEELNTVNSELHRKVEELDRTNDDLRNLFDSTPIGTVFLDRNMVIRTFTPAIGAIFNLIAGDRGRPLTDIANDLEGVDLRHEIEAVLETRQASERRLTRRGRQGHYLMRILPDNAASAPGGVLVSFIDISPMVEIEQHLREFNQGADTMLQMALRISDASLSALRSTANEDGIHRLRSLSAIYRLLSRVEWAALPLRDLITEEAGQLGIALGARIGIEGPPVALKPKAAIMLGLALHELACNAREHGALADKNGKVRLEWRVEAANGKPRLLVRWQESGGPAVAEPQVSGFGRTLIERQLEAEIGATATLDFAPQGLTAEVVVPLSGELIAASAAG
ncbi:MAG: PAS domain-containing protein [Alphaproteobacteria bacterium]|nr:PAS domain-containing protein [Alphaproteobacteria bacterium]